MTDLLLGIDIGTTNIKAVLATPEGWIIAQAHTNYPIHHPKPGWAEQDPADWWRGTVEVTRAVLANAPARPEQIVGIGVSGQGCAVTLIDKAGDVIRPAIIWLDTRSESQCEQMRRCCHAEILQRNGKLPAPYNADPVLQWLHKHEPESIATAQTSLTSTGYINFKLTGQPVENLSDASILFAFDLASGDWSPALVNAFELPGKLYPEVAPCSQVIGELTPAAAAELGLNPGVPVVAGGEDTSSAGLAIGVTEPGQALLSLGTAGTIYIVEDKPIVHPQLLAFLHVLSGQTLLGGSMAAVGAGLNWIRKLFGAEFDYLQLSEMAQQSPPGAGGVIFLPYLSGELQPINDGHARGVFFGLTMSTTPAHMVRAVMEGAAFAIAHNIDIAREAGSILTELRAVGGPTQSELWCRIIANVTGYPLTVLADNAGAPLGNALLAAAGIGLISDPAETARKGARITRQFEPNPKFREAYVELFSIYKQLYPQLKAQFAALAAIKDIHEEPQ
ncbi:MAG: xylulokinase [Anaerolineae bacterium]|nr:xylulokinase [Anaerolineae bacterium]